MTHPSATYEPAACPWCGHDAPTPRYPDLLVVDCPVCGLRYASPQLDDAGRRALYQEHYFRSANSDALGYDDYDADRPQLLHTFRARVAQIGRQFPQPGRLLDVGCATGICVQAARALGWDAEGIDHSAYAVQVGRERYGLPLHCATIEDWDSPKAPYDVLTMWDCLEHVPDPLATLRAARRLLRDGGLLVLTVPDAGSWPARWFGAKWMGYKRDEHLVYFRRPQLAAFLRAAGLEPVFWHYAGKHIRLDFFVRRLAGYTPRLAHALRGLVHAAHLDRAVVYINPMDLACVAARKSDNGVP